MTPSALRILSVALLAGFATLSAQDTPSTSWPLTIEPLPSPAGANSGQPQLSSSPRGVILSWVERDGQDASLRFAERTANGWSPARVVASGREWIAAPAARRMAAGGN